MRKGRRSLWNCIGRCFASGQEEKLENRQQSEPRMSIDRETRIKQWVRAGQGACYEHCETKALASKSEEESNINKGHAIEENIEVIIPKVPRVQTQKKSCRERHQNSEFEVDCLLNPKSSSGINNTVHESKPESIISGQPMIMWDFQETFRSIFPDGVASPNPKSPAQTWFAAGCTASRK